MGCLYYNVLFIKWCYKRERGVLFKIHSRKIPFSEDNVYGKKIKILIKKIGVDAE